MQKDKEEKKELHKFPDEALDKVAGGGTSGAHLHGYNTQKGDEDTKDLYLLPDEALDVVSGGEDDGRVSGGHMHGYPTVRTKPGEGDGPDEDLVVGGLTK